MIKYLKCKMQESKDKPLYGSKDRIKQHNTKNVESFAGAESRYNDFAKEYFALNGKLPSFEKLVTEKGPSLKTIKDLSRTGKNTQESLEPNEEEISN